MLANECLLLMQLLILTFCIRTVSRLGCQTLTLFFCLMLWLANLCVLEAVDLFGFTLTTTDPYAIAAMVSMNVIREKFGQESARLALMTGLASIVLIMLFFTLQVSFKPSASDLMSSHYLALFSPLVKAMAVSLGVFVLAQVLDLLCYHVLSSQFIGLNASVKMFISVTLGQCLDTVLFTWVALQGLGLDLMAVASVSFACKLAVTAFFSLAKPWKCQTLAKVPYVQV